MEIQGYHLPDDLYYDENHFWIRDEGDILVMGMDDFGQKLADQIVYVQLPDDGKKVKQGKKFAKVESGKWLGKVFSPVNGVLVTVNEELESKPGLINKDCYGAGWMYKLQTDDKSELANLVTGAEAIETWMAAEIEKYKDKM